MDCYICKPVCENCKPKFVVCSGCGTRIFLDLPKCPGCGTPITDEMRAIALEEWKRTHAKGE